MFKTLVINNALEKPDCNLITYSGDMLKTHGMLNLDCSYRKRNVKTPFYIVHTNASPLISAQTSIDLGLIKLTFAIDNQTMTKENVMEEYNDLFHGIGLLPGKCHLHLRDNVTPTINAPRRIPEALKKRLKAELDQMVCVKIIWKVTEPTDWVNSIVMVEKSKAGKLRLCLDPKALNEAIRMPHFQMPTLDYITSQLSEAKYFSILDITHAYWNVELSSLLTTFSTAYGRYCYFRLPFGINASSDIFQPKVGKVFEGLPGTQAIVDDILVFGKTKSEHDQNLKNAMNRAREKGVRL